MKTLPSLCIAIALALQSAAPGLAAQPREPARDPSLAALESKLHGAWKGRPCAGDYAFNPDGTFEIRNFTPGGNTLTGTWSLRWDALPPTLVLTYETSDFTKKDPTREEYKHLGKSVNLKLVELNNNALALVFPGDEPPWRGSRQSEK